MNTFLMVILVSACTIMTRVIPFVLFGGKREVPKVVTYLGSILPPAIMAVLIVYCLKNVDVFSANHGLAEFISVAVVAALHLWKRNTLLSIALGTVCYMVLVQFVFL